MKAKISATIFFIVIVTLAGFLIYNSAKNREAVPQDFYPAKFYETLENGEVRCSLCPNRCTLIDGQIGFCKARKNVSGQLYSMVYGKISSAHLDPIEKKPLYHFLPGTTAYSISTTGCNLQCKFCQNWQISQIFPWEIESRKMTPEDVVQEAKNSGAKSIAFTYNEPTVYYEYMYDIARLARQAGLKNVVISSGYINPEPLRELLPNIDAYKIDFKGFNNKFYQEMTVSGRAEPVLESMKLIKETGVWLEIVNLVIPGQNDSDQDLKNLILWVKNNLGDQVPLHFTAFHPDYKLTNVPPTPAETLRRARKLALELGMKYVYTGNVDDPEGNITYCPGTKEIAVARELFFVKTNNLDKNGKCLNGEQVPGVWR